jgi:DNA-binding NarL/FixJ family response regulator
VYTLFFLARALYIPQNNKSVDLSSLSPVEVAHSTNEVNHSTNEAYSHFYLFCKKYQLTTREQDVFKLLLENKNNQIISDQLTISLGTTKSHVHNIFMKADVSNRRELIDIYENWKEE